MGRPLAIAALLAALALVAGCGGDDDSDERAAEDWSAEVERIGDAIDTTVDESLVTLNEVAQASRSGTRAAARLEADSREVARRGEELEALDPPEGMDVAVDDLSFAVDDLARNLSLVSTDLTVAARTGDEGDAARAGARLVLANGSAVSALSRTARSLATEIAD